MGYVLLNFSLCFRRIFPSERKLYQTDKPITVEARRMRGALKPSIMLIFRRTPQTHRLLRLEAKPKETDSLAHGILSNLPDKFSNLLLHSLSPKFWGIITIIPKLVGTPAH